VVTPDNEDVARTDVVVTEVVETIEPSEVEFDLPDADDPDDGEII
jgi:hypothetical protein